MVFVALRLLGGRGEGLDDRVVEVLRELELLELVGVVVGDGVEKGQDNGDGGVIRTVRNVDLGGELRCVVAELVDELLILRPTRGEEPVKLDHVLLLVAELNAVGKILEYLRDKDQLTTNVLLRWF